MMLNMKQLVTTIMAAVASATPQNIKSSEIISQTCSMAEFTCRSETQCIPLDRYCNGIKDCDDGSDEPSGCTPCNRTYYGRIGFTYKLEVARPYGHSLPHFCQLTFIASGFMYGDLIMLSIEKFSLGRFVSHMREGCPDGHMQIEELRRPLNKGYWCGTSQGTNYYYSETSAITLMLRVFNLTRDRSINPASIATSDANVLLRMSYRFLQRHKATLRYGVPYNPNYRGKDVLRSFCNKFFRNCDKKNCRVQSPNFPGMYPRNLTCVYRIRQTQIPPGKVALIRIHQHNSYLMYIKTTNTPHLLLEERLFLDDDCDDLNDHISIYDGNNTRSPQLLKACKGGTLTTVTSSGPEMLIVFKASPYDTPYQDSPRRNVYGFSLEVTVVFVDIDSTAYVRPNKSMSYLISKIWLRSPCEWLFSSRGQRSGFIQAPEHSLLKNTTCIWRLSALPNEIIWLYFYYYKNIPHKEIIQPQKCSNTLNIHDGDLSYGNSTLIKSVCQADEYPLICSGVHARNKSLACNFDESYVSRSRKMSISLMYHMGTVPSHVKFLARYEFVSKRQWGRPLPKGEICDRIFDLRPDRVFSSPKNVFLFGRGGNEKLRCLYVFRVEFHQRVNLRISKAKMGNVCETFQSKASRRLECSHTSHRTKPSIQIVENLWNGVELNRACFCNISAHKPLAITSYTNELKLIFNVPKMAANEDFEDYFFEGEYDILNSKMDQEGHTCKLNGRVHEDQHGNFTIGAGKMVEECSFMPRLIKSTDGAYIYMRIKGFRASEFNCGVASRINVYSAGAASPIASVCPEPSNKHTHVFSQGWSNGIEKHAQNWSYSLHNLYNLGKYSTWSRDLVIEYIGNYSGKAFVTWMEVWQPLPRKSNIRPKVMDRKCPYLCPEIDACLPANFWCDGVVNCPSGIDEGAKACGLLTAFPWASLLAAAALIISLIILLIAVIIHKITTACSRWRRRRRKKKKQKKIIPPPLPSKLSRVDLTQPNSGDDESW